MSDFQHESGLDQCAEDDYFSLSLHLSAGVDYKIIFLTSFGVKLRFALPRKPGALDFLAKKKKHHCLLMNE